MGGDWLSMLPGDETRPSSSSLHDAGSGADLAAIQAYLQQLLPALAKAGPGSTAKAGANADSLVQLGLSREALLAAGLPQHTINALYRAMAAHAGAFRKMVAGEVKQLHSLLAQQAAPQLAPTIQLLDGPIAAVAASSGSGRTANILSKALGAEECAMPALSAALSGPVKDEDASAADADVEGCSDTGLPAGTTFSSMADALSCLGPTANQLVKDYAEAYAAMKENMEVRLRHEQRRGDFLQSKLQQTESTLKEIVSQLDTAHRKIADQHAEHNALASQHAELQQSLAVSHAAHLALQQHHQAQTEAWKAEKQDLEEQHKQQMEAVQQELSSSSAAAAALVESNRQVETLRLLYNEELGRASKLAVELTKATAAADKAAAQEAMWAKQIASSDSRADNAEGMATAMNVTVKQLEAQLQQRQQEVAAKEADGMQLRLMLERSRFAAVAEAAAARATRASLKQQVKACEEQLKEKTTALTASSDQLKLCKMELEGANAQLQAGRSHMKQLMSDLDVEQEKCASLAAALDVAKAEATEAKSVAEVAGARLKSTQDQLTRANDTAAAAQDRVLQLEATLEERTAAQEALQATYATTVQERAALEAEAGSLRMQLAELVGVQTQLAELQEQHEAATARIAQLEETQEALSAKAEQLVVKTFELQELKQQHSSLQASFQDVQQQLESTSSQLAESQAAERDSATHVQQLQEQLEAAQLAKAQLARELLATSAAGNSAQQEVAVLAQQLDDVQAALEAAEMDRQALAAQRDGWMSSFQEAYGKLQEWTVSSEAAARQLAVRAGALQEAMQHISSEAQATVTAEDDRAAAGTALGSDSSGHEADAEPAAGAAGSSPAAATSEVLDQLAGLQQLVRAEAHKQQEVFDTTLKALHQRVHERHQAAQASWQETMATANARRAARSAAKAAERTRRKQSLMAMAAANNHAARVAVAAAAEANQPIDVSGGSAAAGFLNLADATSCAGAPDVDAASASGAAVAEDPIDDQVGAPPLQHGRSDGAGIAARPEVLEAGRQKGWATMATLEAAVRGVDAAAPPTGASAQLLPVQVCEQHSAIQYAQGQQLATGVALQQQEQGAVQYQTLLQQHKALQQQHQQLLQHVKHLQQQQQQQLATPSEPQQQQQAVSSFMQHPVLQQQSNITQHPLPPQLLSTMQQLQDSGGHQIPSPPSAAAGAAAAAAAAVVNPTVGVVPGVATAAVESCGPIAAALAVPRDASPESSGASTASTADMMSDRPGTAGAANSAAVGTTYRVSSAQRVRQTTTVTTIVTSTSRVDIAAEVSGADLSKGNGTVTTHAQEQHLNMASFKQSSSVCMDIAADAPSAVVVASPSGLGEPCSASAPSLGAAVPSEEQAASSSKPYNMPDSSGAGQLEQQCLTAGAPVTELPDNDAAAGCIAAAAAAAVASASSRTAEESSHGVDNAAGSVVPTAEAASSHSAGSQLQLAPSSSMPPAASHYAAAWSSDSDQACKAPSFSMVVAEPDGSMSRSNTAGVENGSPLHMLQLPAAAPSMTAAGPQGLFSSLQLADRAVGSPAGFAMDPHAFGSFGSFNGGSALSSPGVPGALQPGSVGGSLSGFVSLATYQEQMHSVAHLHGQVGQLAVQLREAHADAEGAQQLLQQERQEAIVRTTALREALGQLHGQLEELREDHKQLQESHRALMTKDLLNSGLLRDRYVAGLFERLQEALWKLDVARQRASTWGFDMLVPLGRVNRGIQTQAGEIWAATGAAATHTRLVTGATAVACSSTADTAAAAMHTGSTAGKPIAATCTYSSSSSSVMVEAGGDLSAAADPVAAAYSPWTSHGNSSAAATVPRKAPAFTQHNSTRSSNIKHTAAHVSALSSTALSQGSAAAMGTVVTAAGLQVQEQAEAQLLAAAVSCVAAGNVQLMSHRELLQLVSQVYSDKAAADAVALRQHKQPLSLWAFLLKQLTGGSSSGSDGSAAAVAAVARLLGSLEAHAGSCREVSAFQAALLCSIPHSCAAAAGLVGGSSSGSRGTGRLSRPQSAGAEGGAGADGVQQAGAGCRRSSSTTPRSSVRAGVTFRGSWGELRLDDSKLLPCFSPGQLLPEGVAGLVEQVMQWPGMSALLAWVSGGHFLGGMGPDDLGKAMLDVQAPHIHFLLLEAADILRLHPLPRLHIMQAATPFVRLVRIPVGSPCAKPTHGTTGGGTSSSNSSRDKRCATDACAGSVPLCQRASVLVLSSGALQLLSPAELQAALSGALGPLAVEGLQDDSEVGPSSSSNGSAGTSSSTAAPQLADLATLSSLLALAPAFLLDHLPPMMHAMGGFLAAALLAVERLVAAAGDRASLLVSQDLGAALGALLKTSGVAGAAAMSAGDAGRQESPEGSAAASGPGQQLVQHWRARVEQQQQREALPGLQQLLPQHHKLVAAAAAAAGGGSSKGLRRAAVGSSNGGRDDEVQLSEEEVVLVRVQELLSWCDSPQYQGLMAAARPLRRLLRPGSANSGRCTHSA